MEKEKKRKETLHWAGKESKKRHSKEKRQKRVKRERSGRRSRLGKGSKKKEGRKMPNNSHYVATSGTNRKRRRHQAKREQGEEQGGEEREQEEQGPDREREEEEEEEVEEGDLDPADPSLDVRLVPRYRFPSITNWWAQLDKPRAITLAILIFVNLINYMDRSEQTAKDGRKSAIGCFLCFFQVHRCRNACPHQERPRLRHSQRSGFGTSADGLRHLLHDIRTPLRIHGR